MGADELQGGVYKLQLYTVLMKLSLLYHIIECSNIHIVFTVVYRPPPPRPGIMKREQIEIVCQESANGSKPDPVQPGDLIAVTKKKRYRSKLLRKAANKLAEQETAQKSTLSSLVVREAVSKFRPRRVTDIVEATEEERKRKTLRILKKLSKKGGETESTNEEQDKEGKTGKKKKGRKEKSGVPVSIK